MKMDYLDLWIIHTISSIEDADNRINNGVLDYFLEAKATGKTRYIGFSCHTNPKVKKNLQQRFAVFINFCNSIYNIVHI
jgi:predicted aldo/keto reductase-like oxidoreductase